MGYQDVVSTGSKGIYNTPAKTDTYVRRVTQKTFRLGDQVVYNKNQNKGQVVSLNGQHLQILRKDSKIIDRAISTDVFKESEFTALGHWDAINLDTRRQVVKSLPSFMHEYIEKDWIKIPLTIQELIQKAGGGDTGAVNSAAPATTSQSPKNDYGNDQSGRGYREPNKKSKDNKTEPGNDSSQLSHSSPAGHTVAMAKCYYPSHASPITEEDMEKFK